VREKYCWLVADKPSEQSEEWRSFTASGALLDDWKIEGEIRGRGCLEPFSHLTRV
jgi:hypothetical protein